MAKKLFVGNLAYNVTSDDLQQLFAQHGAVTSAQVIEDRATGRSKGFGFVEMSNDTEAQAAVTALHGQDYGGRPLTVNEARPRESRPGGGDRGGFGGRLRRVLLLWEHNFGRSRPSPPGGGGGQFLQGKGRIGQFGLAA